MENASKALLFAAGILIAIILISVAIYLVNMSQQATTGVASTMTEMQLMQFNNKFEQYNGVRTGAQIKQLVNTINASNVENAGTDLIVNITGEGIASATGSTDTCPQYTCTLGSAKKYKVTLTPHNGAYTEIKVENT